jgi:hypothetical protein
MSPQTKASFILIAALLAAAPAPLPVRAADDESDVAALSKKLRKLEEEVSALRRRLAELGKQPSLERQPAVPLLLAPGESENPPPGWIPRKFNGQRYYAVPLDR